MPPVGPIGSPLRRAQRERQNLTCNREESCPCFLVVGRHEAHQDERSRWAEEQTAYARIQAQVSQPRHRHVSTAKATPTHGQVSLTSTGIQLNCGG